MVVDGAEGEHSRGQRGRSCGRGCFFFGRKISTKQDRKTRKMKTRIGMLGALLSAAAFGADYTAVSPDGKNEIRLSAGEKLTFSVKSAGKERVSASEIKLCVEGRAFTGKALKAEKSQTGGKLRTPIYKKAEIDLASNQTVVEFEGGFKVRLAARNDGVAYRWETDFGEGTVKVKNETAGLTFPAGQQGWFAVNHGAQKGDPLQNSWETVYEKKKVSELKSDKSVLYYAPMTLVYGDGAAMSVTESDLREYSGWNFIRSPKCENSLEAWWGNYPVVEKQTTDQRHTWINGRHDYIVETAGKRTYPWRTFMLGASPLELVGSDIVYALAEPAADGTDFSWVKPGKVAWDWWNDWNISGVDFRAGCNTKTYEYYIDFASENGVEYVIFDEGWSKKLRIWEVHPDVDVPHLVKYAAKRNVGIILWCTWTQLIEDADRIFAHYAAMGVKGFKVDFMDREDAWEVQFLERTAKLAAKHKLLLDYHGMSKPTGMHRMYPNIINYEGIWGLEQCKWTGYGDIPGHDVNTVFTRQLAGPMDYTPGAMRNMTKKAYKSCYERPGCQGTRVHQMALMTAFEAPLQMLCDSPTMYKRNQECFDFMAKVPTTWDDTLALCGTPETYVALARRKGSDWYVAVVNNWDAREVEICLKSLLKDGKGAQRNAETFADGINADRDAEDYKRCMKKVNLSEPLKVKLAPGGGWTARIKL